MEKFFKFMKSTKGLILLALIAFAGIFVAFKKGSPFTDKTSTQKQQLLSSVTEMLERQHYSPKKIDDNFSKTLFLKYLNELDYDKTLFTQEDLKALKKFETKLDDEMHGSNLEFLPALNPIYDKRVNQAITLYKDILSKPFKFDVDENITIDSEKQPFAKDEKEKNDRFRKKLKFLTLERFVELQEAREKAVVDSIKNKTDVELEKEAREKVHKAMDRYFNRIKTKFNEEERFNTYINAIANTMDPHTDYFPPVEKRAFDESMSNRFFGIGAQLGEQDGTVKIVNIMAGGPAWKQGELMANDVILKVAQGAGEPVDIAGYEVTDAVKLIRGTKGTEVRLTVKKEDGTIKTIAIIRDEIKQDESAVRSAVVNEGGNKIGYIYLPDFYANFEDADGARCSDDVAAELEKLKKENVKGIVIDLRFNGGGSLQEVVNMVGLFIPSGPVVQVKDKEGRSLPLYDRNPAVQYDGPLVVMVNEGSASASEIFAAAIQDYKRGLVIGSTSTFGKGTVQRNLIVGNQLDYFNTDKQNGALKLTLQKFYRINGGSTQLKGVVPDVIIPDQYEHLKIREKHMTNALPWDEIAKANYNTQNTTQITPQLIAKAQDLVNKVEAFNVVKQNSTVLSQKTDAPKSLKLDVYKAEQKLVKNTVTQTNNVLKLKEELDIKVMKEDEDKFFNNPDKPKGERYQAWLKQIKADLYIKETSKILNEIIASNSIAKETKTENR
jgi:carboxyl-terminal processing protease